MGLLRKIEVHIYAYVNFFVVFVTGLVRDIIDAISGNGRRKPDKGYVHILSGFSDFFTRRFYSRISDCFARVVVSNAGAYMDLKITEKSDCLNGGNVFTGEVRRVMNLGSYNYLGFGDPDEFCTPAVVESIKVFGPGTHSSRTGYGTTDVHRDLENVVSKFLGTEDSIVYGMGWSTNATTIQSLVGPGDLVISDEFNHNSIIIGVKASGATVKVFKHNDCADLERILRRSIVNGYGHIKKRWGKILVIVEGIYSMEGEFTCLPEIIALKKKYNFYLFLDEAHSIGCMGETGRGVCEYFSIPHSEVDVLMGTFTKSFGAAGGYIAGKKQLIDWLRSASYANIYADSMPVPVAMQVIRVLSVLSDSEDGKNKLKTLHENSVWFRNELKNRKYKVLGDDGSPVVPVVLPPFGLFTEVTRGCLKKNLALVVVSFPACEILQGRVRICLNSNHTRKELQDAINIIEEVCKDLPTKTE